MYKSKSIELINSEGPIVKIEKVGSVWNFVFHGVPYSVVTSRREILEFLCNDLEISDGNKKYLFNSYGTMRLKKTKLKEVIDMLIDEEYNKIKEDKNYFYKEYFNI